MNDVEMLEAVLKSFGIGYQLDYSYRHIVVSIKEGEGGVTGDPYLRTSWIFDEETRGFIDVGIYRDR